MATFTHVGIGIVRTRPCFPMRSTTHQRLSRCRMCFSVSAATSDRRSPQPRRMASIARSRSPFLVDTSGVFRSFCACWTDNQFPTRTPTDLAPFTRAASSGASSPLSAASTANFRTAVMRTLMETDPRPRASNATRQALTVALVKPGRAPSVPGEELVQPQVVSPFGDRRGNAIQDQGFQSAPVRRSIRQCQLVHFSPLIGPYRKLPGHYLWAGRTSSELSGARGILARRHGGEFASADRVSKRYGVSGE